MEPMEPMMIKKHDRWDDTINAWLKDFPEIILTDAQYESLENLIEEHGTDRWSSGLETGQDTYSGRYNDN
jgi:hypothetical protein